MKRSRLTLEEVAAWDNLMQAFGRAALGKRGRADIEAYHVSLDAELTVLRLGLLEGISLQGRMRRFRIRDPKPRLIHAPRFAERVLHRVLMAKMGLALERILVFGTYARLEGKGVHSAVRRVQSHARRWPWYAQIDTRQYFTFIDHAPLMGQLRRKFSDHDLLGLVERSLASGTDTPGRGLPFGALTSRSPANAYLRPADRLVLENEAVRGYVRYMDDMIWWGEDRDSLRGVLAEVVSFLADALGLQVKQPVRVGRSRDGVNICGYRVHPDRLLLSRRRKRRYSAARREAEALFATGEIDAAELQSRMDAVPAVTAQADATVWRRAQPRRVPLGPMVEAA